MKKVSEIKLTYNDGSAKVIARANTKWLFIAQAESGWNQVSLSGDDRNDAYLLRVLENVVVQTMNETNKYGGKK